VPCFDGHKCARLSLPLDYLTEGDGGPKTEIALRMIPATDKENYLGPILVNPGGPGGSGTQLIASDGKSLSVIVGPQFDIVGFDPRGTGATTPLAQCFDTESQKAIWSLQEGSLFTGLNTTDGSIPYTRARHNLVGQKCMVALGGNGMDSKNGSVSDWGLARFMGTPSVATDMLRITQKMGFEKLQYIGYVSINFRIFTPVNSSALTIELWNGK
jgi:pimeloyl-ACP methyl ester carboxylesterase